MGAAIIPKAFPHKEQHLVTIKGKAQCPGAPLQVTFASRLPQNTSVYFRVTHDRITKEVNIPIHLGQTTVVPTPYPYNDLVPTKYRVSVVVQTVAGRVFEKHPLGSYIIRPFRFSA